MEKEISSREELPTPQMEISGEGKWASGVPLPTPTEMVKGNDVD